MSYPNDLTAEQKEADMKLIAAHKQLAEAQEEVRKANEVMDKLILQKNDREANRTSIVDVQRFIASQRAQREEEAKKPFSVKF